MLTALIVCDADPAPLVATFASLVEASVAGVLADVIAVHPDPPSVASMCEPAGASAVRPGDAEAALRDARGEWILVLEAGAPLHRHDIDHCGVEEMVAFLEDWAEAHPDRVVETS